MDENIDRAERREGLGGSVVDSGGSRDIDSTSDRIATCIADFESHGVCASLIDVPDRHSRSLSREP